MPITKARKPRPRRLLEGFPLDTRIVVAGVTWEDYDRFSRAVREGENCRVAFDGKDIELMVLGPFHESLRGIVDAFIAMMARELGLEHQAIGSTSWKRKKVKRGIESDVSYYFDVAKLMAYAEAFRPVKPSQGLPESGPRRRDRYFTAEDRPIRHLRGATSAGDMAVRK